MIAKSAVITILVLMAGAPPVRTDDKNLENDLKVAFENNVVLVRHFYEGKKIVFEADGTATGGKEGIWTIHGYVRINHVRIKNGAILIDGERLAAIYDPNRTICC